MNRLVLTIVLILSFAGLPMAQNMGEVATVTEADSAQQFPDVAYNSTDNTFLVVWEHVIDDTVVEVHGVLVDGQNGQPIGDPVLLLAEGDKIEAPEVAYNSVDNEFLLVARRENDNMVLAQRISPQGAPIDAAVDIGQSTGPTFFDPAARARVVSVAHNATDNQYIIGLSGPLTAQIVFPGLELDIITDTFGSGTNPAVSWSSQSNVYLMAWEDREPRNTGTENLSAQVLSNTGEPVGDTIFIRDQDFAEESPRIAYNPDDDQFLVVWDERIGYAPDSAVASRTDTIGQIVGVDGSTIGDPIPIEADTPYTLRQDVDYNSQSGMYLAVWKGDESGDFAFADIQGRLIARDGSLASEIFLIYDNGDDATDDGSSERYFDESKLPVIAANTNSNGFLVVWEEAGTNRDPYDRNILARFIDLQPVSVQAWDQLK